jgi:hypothetical protein
VKFPNLSSRNQKTQKCTRPIRRPTIKHLHVVATSTKNPNFWFKSLPYYQIVMQHLTHINNISVLFVVDPFESANNMFVDEIETEYLLVLNLNELHLPKFNQNGYSINYYKAAAR